MLNDKQVSPLHNSWISIMFGRICVRLCFAFMRFFLVWHRKHLCKEQTKSIIGAISSVSRATHFLAGYKFVFCICSLFSSSIKLSRCLFFAPIMGRSETNCIFPSVCLLNDDEWLRAGPAIIAKDTWSLLRHERSFFFNDLFRLEG